MSKLDDAILRRRVGADFDWDPSVGASAIGVAVKDGVVTLTGSVSSYPQKQPAAAPSVVTVQIESALARRALGDADQIDVESIGDKVVLRGSVHSWQARSDAEQAAWCARGVASVENYLTVTPAISPVESSEGLTRTG